MNQEMSWVAVSLTFLAIAAMPATVSAHGFAGKRFFPATLATDDPFVADELSPAYRLCHQDTGGRR